VKILVHCNNRSLSLNSSFDLQLHFAEFLIFQVSNRSLEYSGLRLTIPVTCLERSTELSLFFRINISMNLFLKSLSNGIKQIAERWWTDRSRSSQTCLLNEGSLITSSSFTSTNILNSLPAATHYSRLKIAHNKSSEVLHL
jgi:hypothetical protein